MNNNTAINKRIPAVFCWSGGKDSAFALHTILKENIYDVKYLLSTFNGTYNRLSMHGVRTALIEAQANAIGIPLIKVFVFGSSNEEYENNMNKAFLQLKKEGIKTVIYGDIFLADLRQYREEKMKPIGLNCIFPIWQINTQQLIQQFLQDGFKTIICCVNDAYLNDDFVGKIIDENFIETLPKNVDACGENGEFHSFCFDGPIYKKTIQIATGEKMYKPLEIKFADEATLQKIETNGFWFIDLILIEN